MTREQLTEARKIAAISAPGNGIALLVAHIDAQAAEIDRLRDALTTIVQWGPFPDSGKSYEDEHGNTRPMIFGICYGSNGERDYMRQVANHALNGGEK